MSRLVRLLMVAALLVIAITVQVSVFSHFSIDGVTPDLALLIVVAAALIRGPGYGAALGFVAGLLVDLAPPADHTAGRWALALIVVGYLVGLLRHEGRQSSVATMLVVVAATFVGASLFALSGLILGEAPGAGSMLAQIGLEVLYNAIVAPFLVPIVLWTVRRLVPREAW
ncbi:MAG: rod shape-determining protein MreD [Mycobacteriales bacterium]